MRTFTLRQRLRYAFDATMSRGTTALVGWLGLGTALMIGLHALLLTVAGLQPEDVRTDGPEEALRVAWYGLMRAMDAGTLGGDATDWNWPLLAANFGITLGGIFVLSTLISILSSGLEGRIEQLRKGRSIVVEQGHTVILGWTPAIPVVLRQLAEARASDTDGCAVILATRDKVEMEDELRELGDLGTLRVVVRSGDPTDPHDLGMVNVQDSRAVILLHPGDGHDGDILVIKALMALFSLPGHERMHVVTELHDAANRDAAMLVGKEQLRVVLGNELVARVAVQTCRQPGLSFVLVDLLDFEGDEIYFGDAGGVVGKTFGEALLAWNDCAVLGFVAPDGTPRVLPDMDTRIPEGARILVVARDDSMVRPTATPAPDEAVIVAAQDAPPTAERTLVLGWNAHAFRVVRGLDAYVAEGSSVHVVAPGLSGDDVHAAVGPLQRQSLTVLAADPSRREVLESLDPLAWSHVLVLPSDDVGPEAADARVLVTLLHLRDMSARSGASCPVVSEMNDVRNRDLAATGSAEDFIVSKRLVSLMLCQIAENRDLHPVLDDLFDPDGAEVYLKPASRYVRDVETSFATVVAAAGRCGEAAIGFRLGATGEVVINPQKSRRVRLGAQDRVVVVAQA